MRNKDIIRRSRLIFPVNVDKFVKKAYTRNADTLVLDLEDSIPNESKEAARQLLHYAIPEVSKSGSDIFIRVNMDEELLYKDIYSSVYSEIDGIILPKVESPKQVQMVEKWIDSLEKERGITSGKTQIGILIETAKGYLNMKSILESSERIESLTLGIEDFVTNLGIQMNERTDISLKQMRMKVVYTAKAYDVIPMGLMGSIANFSDLTSLEEDAKLAFEHGFSGSSCIHPKQVEILNNSFSYSEDELQKARKIVKIFEKSLSEGRASTTYEGNMIDYPHYEKAKETIEYQQKIQHFENQKQNARKRLMEEYGND